MCLTLDHICLLREALKTFQIKPFSALHFSTNDMYLNLEMEIKQLRFH